MFLAGERRSCFGLQRTGSLKAQVDAIVARGGELHVSGMSAKSLGQLQLAVL
jgi:hypothetical protein